MKKFIAGGFIALALLVVPIAPAAAQVASTTNEVAIYTLKQELISLLMQLVYRLQEQINEINAREAAEASAEAGDDEEADANDDAEEADEEEEDNSVAIARKVAGHPKASGTWNSTEGEKPAEWIEVSIIDYLDIDTIDIDSSYGPSMTEDGCNGKLSGTSIRSCATHMIFDLPQGGEELTIDIEINGERGTLYFREDDLSDSEVWNNI